MLGNIDKWKEENDTSMFFWCEVAKKHTHTNIHITKQRHIQRLRKVYGPASKFNQSSSHVRTKITKWKSRKRKQNINRFNWKNRKKKINNIPA